MNNKMGFQVNLLHRMHVSDLLHVYVTCSKQTRSQLSVSTVKNTHEIKTRGEAQWLKYDSHYNFSFPPKLARLIFAFLVDHVHYCICSHGPSVELETGCLLTMMGWSL